MTHFLMRLNAGLAWCVGTLVCLVIFCMLLVSPVFALDDLGVVSGDTFELPGYNDGPSGGGVWPGSSGSGGEVGAMPLPNGVPDAGGSPHGGPGGGGGGSGSGEGPRVDQSRPPYEQPRNHVTASAFEPFSAITGDCNSSVSSSGQGVRFNTLRPGEPKGPAPSLAQAERLLQDRELRSDISMLEGLIVELWSAAQGSATSPKWQLFRHAVGELTKLLDQRNAAQQVWIQGRFKKGAARPAWCPRGPKADIEDAARGALISRLRQRLIVDGASAAASSRFILDVALLEIRLAPDGFPSDIQSLLSEILNRYQFFQQSIYFQADRLHKSCCGVSLSDLRGGIPQLDDEPEP